MADDDLKRRIDGLRTDFLTVRDKPFEHFYCPILHIDEPAQLCRGHIIPAAFLECNQWVPQRADVDNFYGSATEADFVGVIQDRKKSPIELWLGQSSRQRHKARMEFEGQRLEHYFPKTLSKVAGQTPVTLVSSNDEHICDFVVKLSADDLMALDGSDIQIVVDRDYRAAVVASVIKAAHLTLFNLLGYHHVFSPAGILLADILKSFFLQHRSTPRKQLGNPVESYFRPLACMVLPLITRDVSRFQGTLIDNQVLGCFGATAGVFAIGVIVRAGEDVFCVFVPNGDGSTIDTYFSFLCEPPTSCAVKPIRFVPALGDRESHWESPKGDPIRIDLPPKYPYSDEATDSSAA